MIDFSGKNDGREGAGGNKNGQVKKGAGIKRRRGWNDCKKYQLYEEGAGMRKQATEHDDLISDKLMLHEHASKTREKPECLKQGRLELLGNVKSSG